MIKIKVYHHCLNIIIYSISIGLIFSITSCSLTKKRTVSAVVPRASTADISHLSTSTMLSEEKGGSDCDFRTILAIMAAELSDMIIPLGAQQVAIEKSNDCCANGCSISVRYWYPRSLEAVITYYERQMDYDGWEFLGQVRFKEDVAVLHFSKHDKTVFCVIHTATKIVAGVSMAGSSVLVLFDVAAMNDTSLCNDRCY